MVQEHASVLDVQEIAPSIFQLFFHSKTIARQASPGQFVNIAVEGAAAPLLRRPFSIYSAASESVSIIFNVVGPGTRALSQKKSNDVLDVIGPLGNGVFPYDDDGYETALFVGGGLGVAALPFLHSRIPSAKKKMSFLGARNSNQIIRGSLQNLHVATDDGSEGFHGTVISLLVSILEKAAVKRPRIYGCGPTRMMRALKEYALREKIQCYLALECEMACGIGLCQGCPVESLKGERKFDLVCRDGPVFEASTVNI